MRRVVTALATIGYEHALSYDHEDSVMYRGDGCGRAIAFLGPLLIKNRLNQALW